MDALQVNNISFRLSQLRSRDICFREGLACVCILALAATAAALGVAVGSANHLLSLTRVFL
jgi:hypothetical protein